MKTRWRRDNNGDTRIHCRTRTKHSTLWNTIAPLRTWEQVKLGSEMRHLIAGKRLMMFYLCLLLPRIEYMKYISQQSDTLWYGMSTNTWLSHGGVAYIIQCCDNGKQVVDRHIPARWICVYHRENKQQVAQQHSVVYQQTLSGLISIRLYLRSAIGFLRVC